MSILKPKILLNFKDHPDLTSGYAIMSRHLFPLLRDHYGAENLLIYAPVYEKGRCSTWQGIKVLPGTEFGYGENSMLDHYERHNCNLLFQAGDGWPLGKVADLAAAGEVYWLQWLPVDWMGMPKNIINRIKPCHHIVPFSKYGEKALRQAGLSNVGEAIWLGLDTDVWKPMDRRELPDMMRVLNFREDTFNIVIVGANQERKRIREMLETIHIFRVVNPEISVRIYLHMPLMGERDLNADLDELLLSDIYCGPDPYLWTTGGIPEKEMVEVFNCADVVMNLAMEGFGFAHTQAQACGVPVVHFCEGAGPELVKFGASVPMEGKETSPHQMAVGFPSVVEAAHALQLLHKKRMEMGAPLRNANAVQWVQENLSWKKIAGQWIEVIDWMMMQRSNRCMDIPEPCQAFTDQCKQVKEVG